MPDDEPIKSNSVTRAVRGAQTQIEQENFEMRKNVLKYDETMDQQRKVVYKARSRILKGENLHPQVMVMLVEVISAYVKKGTAGRRAASWDLDALRATLKTLYPIAREPHSPPYIRRLTRKSLLHAVIEDALRALVRREAEIEERDGPGAMCRLEREILLDSIDAMWREHLYEMDYLKTGIGLRALANRDPAIEYQSEGFDMFVQMLEAVKEQCIRSLFHPTT